MSTRLWSHPQGEKLLRDLGLGRRDALAGAVEAGRLLSIARQSAAVVTGGEVPLLVKWRRTLPGHRVRTLLRSSHEAREARAMLGARSLGISCPLPLVVVEVRRAGILEGALLVRRFLEERRDAAELLALEDVGGWLLQEVRGWHERGFRHGDCWPRNILVSEQKDEAVPIGCPKARFVRPRRVRDRGRIRDTAALLFGILQAREGCGAGELLTSCDGVFRTRVMSRLGVLRAHRERRPTPVRREARRPAFPEFHLWDDGSLQSISRAGLRPRS